MKPANASAARIRRYARIGRVGSIILLALAFLWIGMGFHRLRQFEKLSASSFVSETARTVPRVPSRPDLVEQIAQRPLRATFVEPVAPATKPVFEKPTVIASPAPPVTPSFELIATSIGESRQPVAFVRFKDRKVIQGWSVGSGEGPFIVTEIGDGWITVQAEGYEHRLQLAEGKR